MAAGDIMDGDHGCIMALQLFLVTFPTCLMLLTWPSGAASSIHLAFAWAGLAKIEAGGWVNSHIDAIKYLKK